MKVFATVTGEGRKAGSPSGANKPLPVIANQNASIAPKDASPSQRSRRAVRRAGGRSSVRFSAALTSNMLSLLQIDFNSRFRGIDGKAYVRHSTGRQELRDIASALDGRFLPLCLERFLAKQSDDRALGFCEFRCGGDQ